MAFESASVIGVVEAGRPVLNPSGDLVIGDRVLIVVAEDDSGLDVLTASEVVPDQSAPGIVVTASPEPTRAVVIGWNERAPIMLRELDKYAPTGSTLTVLTSFAAPVLPALSNLAVTVVVAPMTDRATLDRHVVEGLDQVLVLCYSSDLKAQAADARTLVSEMLDDRNRVLAQVAHVDDVVVSGEIVSLLVTQLSEDPRLEAVFDQLLGETGSEIYLRPAQWCAAPGAEVSYATVVAGAARRGETALGYAGADGVIVNPAKSTRLLIVPGDRVVVLAES